MTLTIRDSVAEDVPILQRLMHCSFDPLYGEAWSIGDLAATLNLPGVRSRLALRQTVALGFCLTYHVPDAAELLMIAVDPDARRQGIARDLLVDATATARLAGLASLFLEVREGNAAARALYTAFGFTVSGRRANYYKGQDKILRDAVTLRLPLR